MIRRYAGLLNGFMLMVILSGGCPGIENLAGNAPERGGLQDRFAGVRTGMGAAQIEEILGPPELVISDEDDPSHRIHVWRERWFGFVRAAVLVKFENDSARIASCSSGNIQDPAAWVEDIEMRSGKNPGALLSEEESWAELSSILAKLDESWASRDAVEPKTASVFDSVTTASSLESVLEQLGTPNATRTVYGAVTHVWDLGEARLMFTFERETLKTKQLDTFDLEIIVREKYWRARDKRRGLTVTEYL